MNSISLYTPNTLQRWDLGANITNELHLTRIAASSQRSKEITLFTEEGDKVTISSAEQRQMGYSTYEAMSFRALFGTEENPAVVGDQLVRLQGERVEFETSGSLVISVEGDLNERELKDIKEALKIIDKLMRHVLTRGDISESIDKVLRLGSLDSISSIEANYQYERTMFIERDVVKEGTTYSSNELPEDIAEAGDNGLGLEDLSEQIKKIIVNSGVKPTQFVKPLKRLFSNIIKELRDDRPQNKPKIRLAKLMEKRLIQGLE